MKKTLSFTVGLMLLLFTAHCCRAISVPVSLIPPEKCCFDLFEGKIPRRKIASIGATDSRCPTPAYRITTIRGKEFCVGQTTYWRQLYVDAIN